MHEDFAKGYRLEDTLDMGHHVVAVCVFSSCLMPLYLMIQAYGAMDYISLLWAQVRVSGVHEDSTHVVLPSRQPSLRLVAVFSVLGDDTGREAPSTC